MFQSVHTIQDLFLYLANMLEHDDPQTECNHLCFHDLALEHLNEVILSSETQFVKHNELFFQWDLLRSSILQLKKV